MGNSSFAPCCQSHNSLSSNSIKELYTITQMRKTVTLIHPLKNNRIAVCCSDFSTSIIKIFSLYQTEYKCDIIIDDDNHQINSLCQLSNSDLVISMYNNVKIYKISEKSYTFSHSVETGFDTIIKSMISLSNNRIATILLIKNDIAVYYYPTEGNIILAARLARSSPLCHCVLAKEFLWCTSTEGTIEKWNIDTYQCISVIHPDNVSMRLLACVDDRLLSKNLNSIVSIDLDIYRVKKEKEIDKEESISEMITFDEENVLCLCESGKICVYNKEDKEMCVIDSSNRNRKMLTKINSNYFMCYEDNNIKIWKVNSIN